MNYIFILFILLYLLSHPCRRGSCGSSPRGAVRPPPNPQLASRYTLYRFGGRLCCRRTGGARAGLRFILYTGCGAGVAPLRTIPLLPGVGSPESPGRVPGLAHSTCNYTLYQAARGSASAVLRGLLLGRPALPGLYFIPGRATHGLRCWH